MQTYSCINMKKVSVREKMITDERTAITSYTFSSQQCVSGRIVGSFFFFVKLINKSFNTNTSSCLLFVTRVSPRYQFVVT